MMGTESESELDIIDLATALGSESNFSVQCLSVYVPDKDKNGKGIENQRAWVLEAIELLTEINGGATAMPPVEGAWRNDKGKIVWENPVVVYSYIRAERFLANLPRVREFLHRLGRATNQAEIAFEFDGQFHRIRVFDSAKRKKP